MGLRTKVRVLWVMLTMVALVVPATAGADVVVRRDGTKAVSVPADPRGAAAEDPGLGWEDAGLGFGIAAVVIGLGVAGASVLRGYRGPSVFRAG